MDIDSKLLEYISDYTKIIRLNKSVTYVKDFIDNVRPRIDEYIQNNIIGKFIKFNNAVMYVERHSIDLDIFHDEINISLYGISYEYDEELVEYDDEKLSNSQFYSSRGLDGIKFEELNNIVLINKSQFIEESKDKFERYLKCLLKSIKE
jgi:hypothetical protein